MISVIIPCFNESENVHAIAEGVHQHLNSSEESIDILFVDDGSTDNTLQKLRELEKSGRARYISFTRNFGHQAALRAGLDHAHGEAVIMMDGDLQHPPSLLPVLIARWKEGYQVVNGVRQSTEREGLFKKMTSRLYYPLFEAWSGLSLQPGSADFRLLDKRVVDELRHLSEPTFFLRGLISWLGFKTVVVPYTADVRLKGRTKYSLKKMVTFARDGLMSFSIRPLRIAGIVGLLVSSGAGLYILYSLYIAAFTDRAVRGWTSILVSVLFVGGVQMVFMGLLGEYVGKIFIESKRRPAYVIKEGKTQ